MKIDDIDILKRDERGIIYDCEPVKYIVRRKGTISADHTHEEAETLYILEGEAELTIGTDTKTIKAPMKVTFQSNEYHKLLALTDIKFIELRFTN